MSSRFIIIAILIFVKVVGVASHAKADFSLDKYLKEVEERHKKAWRESFWNRLESEKTSREETTGKIIFHIDDHSYTVDYLNGKKEYCTRNDFEVITCLDYSQESNKKTFNKKTNGKISKDEESEMKAKDEFILSMTLSTLFNIT